MYRDSIRFSYCMLPQYPMATAMEIIQAADQAGLYATYATDEIWHKDLWLMFAAAADKTEQIRLGPNVTHVFLREPTLICQQLATLDELTGGRAEAVVSTGNFQMMEQYHIDWAKRKPLSRLREALGVMRTFLDEGRIDFEGSFFSYTGLTTAARPVQERLPLKMGGAKGPKSFETAGEIADGLHHSLSYKLGAWEYVRECVERGAKRAGRDLDQFDLAAWVATVIVEDDPQAAKDAARILVAFYLAAQPDEQFERHGIDPAEIKPIVATLAGGEVGKAVEMVTPELAETLSLAGTPEECVEKIRSEFVPAGVDHMVLGIVDGDLVKYLSGLEVSGVPSAREQIQLTAERIMPAFA